MYGTDKNKCRGSNQQKTDEKLLEYGIQMVEKVIFEQIC